MKRLEWRAGKTVEAVKDDDGDSFCSKEELDSNVRFQLLRRRADETKPFHHLTMIPSRSDEIPNHLINVKDCQPLRSTLNWLNNFVKLSVNGRQCSNGIVIRSDRKGRVCQSAGCIEKKGSTKMARNLPNSGRSAVIFQSEKASTVRFSHGRSHPRYEVKYNPQRLKKKQTSWKWIWNQQHIWRPVDARLLQSSSTSTSWEKREKSSASLDRTGHPHNGSSQSENQRHPSSQFAP